MVVTKSLLSKLLVLEDMTIKDLGSLSKKEFGGSRARIVDSEAKTITILFKITNHTKYDFFSSL